VIVGDGEEHLPSGGAASTMATGGEARLSSSASDVCDMGFPPGPRLYTGGQTKELAAGVERALAALQPKEAQVVRRRFGVRVETPQTLNETEAVFGADPSAGGRGPEPARSRSARKLKEPSHRRLKREAERKRGRSP